MALNYSENLPISCDVISAALIRNLQAHTLEKLASGNHFLQTGMATLKVKASTDQPPKTITPYMDQTGESLRFKYGQR